MADRYFVDRPIVADRVVLTGEEAHHLLQVMRAQLGQRVVLFDGSGAEFPAVVERLGRHEVELAVLSRQEVDRELPLELVLGTALPKGDRQRWLVEKAVELGLRRLVPLRTARSVAQPTPAALLRLRRAVIEASQQCGRNRLMEIAEPMAWSDFVAASRRAAGRLLAHPATAERGHSTFPSCLPDETHSRGVRNQECPLFLAVGPEGGFTVEEVALAQAAGWRAVDLGPRLLRTETAAVLLIALAIAGARGKGSVLRF